MASALHSSKHIPIPFFPLQNECVAQLAERPPYKELEGILRGVSWSMSSKPVGGGSWLLGFRGVLPTCYGA